MLVAWLWYYIVGYTIFKQTLGTYCFYGRITPVDDRAETGLRVLFREIFASWPGILLIILLFLYYSCYLFELIQNRQSATVTKAVLALPFIFIIILIILTLSRKKIFGLSIVKLSVQNLNRRVIAKRTLVIYAGVLAVAFIARTVNTLITNRDIIGTIGYGCGERTGRIFIGQFTGLASLGQNRLVQFPEKDVLLQP